MIICMMNHLNYLLAQLPYTTYIISLYGNTARGELKFLLLVEIRYQMRVHRMHVRTVFEKGPPVYFGSTHMQATKACVAELVK